jgi:hypothetical protein
MLNLPQKQNGSIDIYKDFEKSEFLVPLLTMKEESPYHSGKIPRVPGVVSNNKTASRL